MFLSLLLAGDQAMLDKPGLLQFGNIQRNCLVNGLEVIWS